MTRDRPPAPFVVGVGRSGTTLLRLMLDAHPELAIGPGAFAFRTPWGGIELVKLNPDLGEFFG